MRSGREYVQSIPKMPPRLGECAFGSDTRHLEKSDVKGVTGCNKIRLGKFSNGRSGWLILVLVCYSKYVDAFCPDVERLKFKSGCGESSVKLFFGSGAGAHWMEFRPAVSLRWQTTNYNFKISVHKLGWHSVKLYSQEPSFLHVPDGWPRGWRSFRSKRRRYSRHG